MGFTRANFLLRMLVLRPLAPLLKKTIRMGESRRVASGTHDFGSGLGALQLKSRRDRMSPRSLLALFVVGSTLGREQPRERPRGVDRREEQTYIMWSS